MQSTFGVTNNFIWEWFLLSLIQLVELVKTDVCENKEAINE